jgi:hypothetical protein
VSDGGGSESHSVGEAERVLTFRFVGCLRVPGTSEWGGCGGDTADGFVGAPLGACGVNTDVDFDGIARAVFDRWCPGIALADVTFLVGNESCVCSCALFVN